MLRWCVHLTWSGIASHTQVDKSSLRLNTYIEHKEKAFHPHTNALEHVACTVLPGCTKLSHDVSAETRNHPKGTECFRVKHEQRVQQDIKSVICHQIPSWTTSIKFRILFRNLWKINLFISIHIVNWYTLYSSSPSSHRQIQNRRQLSCSHPFLKKLFLKVHYVTFSKTFVSDDTGGLYVNFIMLPHAAACCLIQIWLTKTWKVQLHLCYLLSLHTLHVKRQATA